MVRLWAVIQNRNVESAALTYPHENLEPSVREKMSRSPTGFWELDSRQKVYLRCIRVLDERLGVGVGKRLLA
jgi:hypothetical protein